MVGFRNNPAAESSTIDWSYLDPPVYDYNSVTKVGDTPNSTVPSVGDEEERNRKYGPGSHMPSLPPMVGIPQPLPDDYEYPQIPSILGTDYVANTMMYGNPKGPGNLTVPQMSNIYKNVGDQQAYTLQSARDFMDAGMHATPQQVHENSWLNQTGFDAQGNYHPEYDPNVGIHRKHMADIANYGAHESTNSGGMPGSSNPVQKFIDPLRNDQRHPGTPIQNLESAIGIDNAGFAPEFIAGPTDPLRNDERHPGTGGK